MKIRSPLAFFRQALAVALVASLGLSFATSRSQAQNGWGGALSFDGTNAVVVMRPGIWFSNAFTIESWVYVRSYKNWSRLLDFGNGAPGDNVILCLSEATDGHPTFRRWLGNDRLAIVAPDPLPTNRWVHLAATLNNQDATLYVNGSPVVTTNNWTPPAAVPRIHNYIGHSPWAGNENADAIFDDLRIWNVARTEAEIVANMSHPLTGTESNLIGYWKCDGRSGMFLQDETGGGNFGSLVGGPQWLPSTIPAWGNALAFNGVDSQVFFTRPVSNDFTLECWFKTTQTNFSDFQWYFGAGMIDGEVPMVMPDFGLSLGAGKLLFGVGGAPGWSDVTIRSGVVADGLWHHAAATRHQESGAMQLYVDGVLVDANTNSIGATLDAPQQLCLGSLTYGNYFFEGQLDEVRIWNLVRTVDEIREGMCHPVSGTEPNLAAYFRLDEDQGGVAHDATLHGFDGMFNGGLTWTNSSIPPFNYNAHTDLPGIALYYSSVAWGDYDNDGRLDMLMTGYGDSYGLAAQIWHNTPDGLTNVTTTVAPGLTAVQYSSVAWGDFDNDGQLDFLLTGLSSTGQVSQIWRNTGTNFSEVTSTLAPGLPGVYWGSVAWGDYDNDGRLDFLLTGNSPTGLVAQIWRNTGVGFSNVTDIVAPGLPSVWRSSVAWADYDSDGRLDFLLTGMSSTGHVSQIWRNTGVGFSNVTETVAPGLPAVDYGSVAWGDYDGDGRLDFLLTGYWTTNGVAQVWRNMGNCFSNVTAAVAPGLPGTYFSSIAWGDFDNDGRLDFLVSGETNQNPRLAFTQIWRNTGQGDFVPVDVGFYRVELGSAALGDYDGDGRLDILMTGLTDDGHIIAYVFRNLCWNANTRPAAPGGLAVSTAGSSVNLRWTRANDAQTSASGLTYNVRVGTTPGGSDVVAPNSGSAGERRLADMGNAQSALQLPLSLQRIGRYYWSVQAVDSALAGSSFSAESSFTLWPALGPDSGPVPGDTSGDGIVDANEFNGVLAHLNGNGIVNQSEFDAVARNYWGLSSLPYMTNLMTDGQGTFQVGLTNAAAWNFSVDVSTNLVDWEYLGPAWPSLGFYDPQATNQPQRFYRLSWP